MARHGTARRCAALTCSRAPRPPLIHAPAHTAQHSTACGGMGCMCCGAVRHGLRHRQCRAGLSAMQTGAAVTRGGRPPLGTTGRSETKECFSSARACMIMRRLALRACMHALKMNECMYGYVWGPRYLLQGRRGGRDVRVAVQVGPELRRVRPAAARKRTRAPCLHDACMGSREGAPCACCVRAVYMYRGRHMLAQGLEPEPDGCHGWPACRAWAPRPRPVHGPHSPAAGMRVPAPPCSHHQHAAMTDD